MKKKYYTGLAENDSPLNLADTARTIAANLFYSRYTLRYIDGNPITHALALEAQNASERYTTNIEQAIDGHLYHPTWWSLNRAKDICPEWASIQLDQKMELGAITSALIGRNTLDHSEFLILHTYCGSESEKDVPDTANFNTRFTLRVADHYNIPVFNLANSNASERLLFHINGGWS